MQNDFDREQFRRRLKFLREYRQLSQRQVADALHIERSTYTSYETGRSEPSLQNLKRLAALYQVSTDFLLDSSPMTCREGGFMGAFLTPLPYCQSPAKGFIPVTVWAERGSTGNPFRYCGQ